MSEKSFADLKKYYNIDLDRNSIRHIELEPTRNGMLTYQYPTLDGKEVYAHSRYNPLNEVEAVLKGMDFNRDKLYIVYGLGLGYHIDTLVERKSSQSIVFVVEKEADMLKTYCEHIDIEVQLARKGIFLFFGNEEQIAAAISNKVFAFNIMPLMTNVEPVILPGFARIYGMEWINELNKRIMDVFRHAYFILGNDIEDTIIGLKNNLENIIELIKSPGIASLYNSYKRVPAIIVSAGPSLNKNIDVLRQAQGKALILATDATLSVLQQHGIIPDAVFSIERVEKTYQAFYKDREIDPDIVFVGPPVVRPEILSSIKGKKLLALKQGEAINEWLNDLLGDNRLLLMGTSCAHICFSFARHVGADPIIFIGQDLAYSREGITHAEGVEIKEQIQVDSLNSLFVEGIDGGMLPTSAVFKNFLVWFETQIAADDSNRRYIDATEGGALIRGTQLIPLKKVVKEYCTKNTIPLRAVAPGENDWAVVFKKVLDEVRLKKQQFYNIRQEAGKHILALDKFENNVLCHERLNAKECQRLAKTLNKAAKVENMILNNRFVSTFFQALMMTTIAQVKALGNEVSEASLRENFRLQKRLFAGIVGGCFIIEDELDKIIQQMEQKIEEGEH